MNKLITPADLSEQMIDYLNGMNAVISALAEKAGVSDQEVQKIQHAASAAGKRELADTQRRLKDMEDFLKDKKAMTVWLRDSHYIYANAKEWAQAAEIAWKAVGERNGSEHGKPHDFRYKEPTEAELFAALKEYGAYFKSTDPQHAGHRARCEKVLPAVRKKLADKLAA